jgi:phosphate transport system permease protein
VTGAQIAARAARHAGGSAIPKASGADRVFAALFRIAMFGAIGLSILALVTLLYDVARDGAPSLSWDFLTSFPSRIIPSNSGIESAIYGTLYLMVVCAVIVVPLGIATAIYLEEYADRDRWWNRLIEVNIQNLAAVPSVVYGILGLAFIVRGPLDLGRVVLAGGITLALLVLPVVIIVSREAIRAVPGARRHAVADHLEAGAAGLDRRHRDRHHPRALPGDRRDGPTARHRRGGEPALQSGRAVLLVHRPPHPDLHLDAGQGQGVRRPRGGDDPRDDADPAADELRRDLPPQPIRAEVVTTEWPRT